MGRRKVGLGNYLSRAGPGRAGPGRARPGPAGPGPAWAGPRPLCKTGGLAYKMAAPAKSLGTSGAWEAQNTAQVQCFGPPGGQEGIYQKRSFLVDSLLPA